MKYQTTVFQGIVPRYEPQLLDQTQAQEAENCDVLSGRMDPIKGTTVVTTVPAGTKSIFPYPTLSTWLNWTTDVDVVRNPLAEDSFDRIYFTGDGVPKVRGTTLTVGEEFPLGVPKPTNKLTLAAQDKTATTTWTREWHYQYEDANGTITQEGTLTEGVDITETTPGKLYNVPVIPARTTAGDTDQIIAWFDAFDANGILLGRLYPETSFYAANTDFILEGARASAAQASDGGTGGNFVISYDTSRASEYEVFRSYLYTFVTKWEEESAPSLASDVVAINPAEDAKLTNFDVNFPTVSHTNIDTMSLYRTVTTEAGTFFQFVDDIGFRRSPAVSTVATNKGGGKVGIPLTAHLMGTSSRVSITGGNGAYTGTFDVDATTTANELVITHAFDATPFLGTEIVVVTQYIDSKTDSEMGRILPSENWDEPPATLAGLVSMPNGFFAGFVGRTVYFSEPFQPHAWPAGFAITVDYDIVGLGVSENTLVTCTKGTPYAMTGTSPDVVVPSQIPMNQACASKRSIANVMNVVIYASPDGLVAVQGGIGELITENYYRRIDWQELNPSSMIGEVHDNRYHGITTLDHIIFDLDESKSALVSSSVLADGLYSDLESDTLYMVVGTNIVSWRTNATKLTAKWRSKRLHFARRMSWNVMRVVAESYPVIVRAYSKDPAILALTVTFNSDEARRIKRMRDDKDWEFEIESTKPVREFTVSTSMADL